MIKYLGSIGFYLRLNDNENKDYRLFEVFSSSAANNSLFYVDINNSVGQLLYSSSGVSSYITGMSGSYVAAEKWTHTTFSFDPPLPTYDTNNFLVRFGDSASCNFNIQNLYMTKQSFSPTEVQYLNQEFIGTGNRTLTVNDNESNLSVNIIDYPEENYISSVDKLIYQPIPNQILFDRNVTVATDLIINQFVSASVMSGDDLFFDGYQVSQGDTILSLNEGNILYTVTASSTLSASSLPPGTLVKIINGNAFSNNFYLISGSGSANISTSRKKIDTILNYIE